MKTSIEPAPSTLVAMTTLAALALGGCGGFKSAGTCSDVLASGRDPNVISCTCDNAALTNPKIPLCCKTGAACMNADSPPNPSCAMSQGTLVTPTFNATNFGNSGFISYGEEWFIHWTYMNAGRIDLPSSSSFGFSPRVTFTQESPNTGDDKLKLPAAISAPWATLSPCGVEPHSSDLAAVPMPTAGGGLRSVIVSLDGVPVSAAKSTRVSFQ
jgi:hypothetical protein